MKRLIIIFITFVGITTCLYSQQSPLYTQYMNNPYVLDPAIAGTVNFFQARIISRWQWVGFTDAPITSTMSVYGPWSAQNKDMGYGVTVYDDVTGPISRMELNGSYAYNIALSAEIRMSFGANFGVLQYKIDGSKLTTTTTPDEQTTYDAIIPNGVWSKFFPDAAAGVYVYRNDFHIGLSADNLFNQTILNNQPINGQSKALGKLQSNFYLLGSYYYIINRHYAVESSGMIQKVIPAPYQFDINVKGIYMNTAWLGISYRSQDAISILMGYTFNKRILVGYSFDWSLSAISRYNIGTHEIMLAYKFNPLK